MAQATEHAKSVSREAWLRLAACAAAAALLQMDGTIVTVALPSVGDEFDASQYQVSWVLTAYFASYGLTLFPGGMLVDRIGSRRTALIGLAVFAAGAALGAIAGSVVLLVGSRIVSGVGAGFVSPASLAGAVSGFPSERRGSALGIWGASSGMANLVGPLVGGLLTVTIGWRACWWFFVPASIAVAAAIVRFVPYKVHADESPETSSLRQRRIAAAAVTALLTFIVMIGAFFIAQQYLQLAAGYSALGAAAALTVVAVLVGVAAPLSGRICDRSGERPAALIGWLLVAAALAVLAVPAVALDGPVALAAMAPFGLGLGMLFVPASRSALNAVPRARHGRVSSLLSTARLLGGALGAILAGTALSGGVTAGHVHTALLVASAASLVIGVPTAFALSGARRKPAAPAA